MLSSSNVFHIGSHENFLLSLSRGVVARFGSDPLACASCEIYLPTKRSCQQLEHIFVHDMGLAILPKITPLGEGQDNDHRHALTPHEEHQLMMGLLKEVSNTIVVVTELSALAELILRFIARLERDNMALDVMLQKIMHHPLLKEHNQAYYWLKEIVALWPNYPKKQGKTSAIERRNAALRQRIHALKKATISTPIIIAGSTGSTRLTREFMTQIGAYENGFLVFAGLDLIHISETEITPQQPHYFLKKTLKALEVSPENIALWQGKKTPQTDRQALLSQAMCPWQDSHLWHQQKKSRSIEGLTLIEADNEHEEAKIIAMLLRQNYENKDAVTACVTPNAGLAKAIRFWLKKWQIQVPFSHGQSLKETKEGAFFCLLSSLASDPLSPLVLSYLKSPYIALENEAIMQWEKRLRYKTPHLRTLSELITASQEGEIKQHLQMLEAYVNAMESAASFTEKLACHYQFFHTIASSQEVADFYRDMGTGTESSLIVTPEEYHKLIDAYLEKTPYFQQEASTNRIKIMSPMEARLLQVDHMVLAGMTDDVWPGNSAGEPWFNQRFYEDAALASSESHIGQSALDFMLLCQQKDVVFSYAKKTKGSVSTMSRFLQRLMTLTGDIVSPLPWQAWAKEQAASCQESAMIPMPTPPISMRPNELYVTDIERLMRNPYGFYARKILTLYPLEPLGQLPGAKEFGVIVHHLIDTALRLYDDNNLSLEALQKASATMLAPYHRAPNIWFWHQRVRNILCWIIDDLEQFDGQILHETQGEMTITIEAKEYVIKAIADRIDLQNGHANIIDYKTGTVPTKTDMALGFSPQLPVEVLLLEKGGFTREKTTSSSASFWKITGGEIAVEKQKQMSTEGDFDLESIESGLSKLLQHYLAKETPFYYCPLPDKAPGYDDYAQLARYDLWRYR